MMRMSNMHRNGEGYLDHTAGKAFQKIEREEAMAKKRRCRRTESENIIHEKAVKMRKMTDEQLVHYVDDRVEKARSEGFHQGRRKAPKTDVNSVIKEIGAVKGIGEAKLCKIRLILEKRLGAENG